MTNRFDNLFLSQSSSEHYRWQQSLATEQIVAKFAEQKNVYQGATPKEFQQQLAGLAVCPEVGLGTEAVTREVAELFLGQSLNLNHPTAMAHLHCPPLLAGLVAETMLTAVNPSMDSFDQAPSATYIEQKLIDWLGQLVGYDQESDGIFTSGGTQSNLMGLLLARDSFARQSKNWNIQQQGLPADAANWRILVSEVGHFSVKQAAALLGLGHHAVVPVAVDQDFQMSPEHLARAIQDIQSNGKVPIAIIATAGTTDFGSIDPLPEIAAIAGQHQIWLHVDAAFAGALLMSDHHRQRLAGLNMAQSITIDFHKLFYQPISCGAFLLKDKNQFDLMALHADYLNPKSNLDHGILDLVGKSLQTTRRFDGLKLWISLRSHGRQVFAAIIEQTIDLARQVAQAILERPRLQLAVAPQLNTVLFRHFDAGWSTTQNDQYNHELRLKLLFAGKALIAETRINGKLFLKLTLMNPNSQLADILPILDEIAQKP